MFKGGGDLVHLDQVVTRLGTGFADRLHRAGLAGQGFGNGNRLVSLTLYGLSQEVVSQLTLGCPNQPIIVVQLQVSARV